MTDTDKESYGMAIEATLHCQYVAFLLGHKPRRRMTQCTWRAAKTTVIDFSNQIGVYVLYDRVCRPIYVGQAGQGSARLFNRLRTHRRDGLAHR